MQNLHISINNSSLHGNLLSPSAEDKKTYFNLIEIKKNKIE